MSTGQLRPLQYAVASWAFMGLVGIPLLVFFDPLNGWRWPPYNPIYDQMIVSIYVALGFSAFRAIRNPLSHRSLLWFIIYSSVTHGLVMFYHALAHPINAGHLLGDVWILAGAVSLAIPLYRARSASSNI